MAGRPPNQPPLFPGRPINPNRPVVDPDRPSIGTLPARPRPGWTGLTPNFQRPPVKPTPPIGPSPPPQPVPPGNITNIVVNNNQTNTNIVNHQVILNQGGGGGSWGNGWNNGTAWGGPVVWASPGKNWQQYWYNRHVAPVHHSWYHGCWTGHGWSGFHSPLVPCPSGWGVSRFSYSSGYLNYVNPYLVAGTLTPVFQHYAEPIALIRYGDESVPRAPDALRAFEQARFVFYHGEYGQARALAEQCLADLATDPTLHEFYALTLFMNGEYKGAAVVLHALLAAAPGWDWTTMISLYQNPDDYTKRLRMLERRCTLRPGDAASAFVLAYHYTVCGDEESARRLLKLVVAQKPSDKVAAQMLEAISAPTAQPVAAESRTGTDPTRAPPIDLVGAWRAARPNGTVDLSLQPDGGFTWQFGPDDNRMDRKGTWSLANDLLVLESPVEGALVGRVTPISNRRFTLKLVGGPPDDPGMTFAPGAPTAPGSGGD